MRRFLMALALTGLLTVSALAGDSSTSGSPAPAPNGTVQPIITTPGEIPISGVVDQISTDALSTLMSVLGFLTA